MPPLTTAGTGTPGTPPRRPHQAQPLTKRGTTPWLILALLIPMACITGVTVAIYREPPRGATSAAALRAAFELALHDEDAPAFASLMDTDVVADPAALAETELRRAHEAGVDLDALTVTLQGRTLTVGGPTVGPQASALPHESRASEVGGRWFVTPYVLT